MTTTSSVVVDASALVDVLAGTPVGPAVAARLRGSRLQAPAHVDAEVLSALGRLARAGLLTERQVGDRLRRMASSPVRREPVAPLLSGAWRRRHNVRLVDALYVELAHELGGIPLITTDARLASVDTLAELVV